MNLGNRNLVNILLELTVLIFANLRALLCIWFPLDKEDLTLNFIKPLYALFKRLRQPNLRCGRKDCYWRRRWDRRRRRSSPFRKHPPHLILHHRQQHSTPQKAAHSMIIDCPITSSLHPNHGSGYPLVLYRVQVDGGDLAPGGSDGDAALAAL